MQKAGRGYTALQRLSPDPALTMGSTPACLSLKSRAERREALGAERQPCVAFALQALRQPGASERVWR